MMGVSLILDGDIELNSDISEGDGYRFELVATSKRGNPVPVEVVLASFLRDGAIVTQKGNDNRELMLNVRVTAPDVLALNLGEERLNRAAGKRTTLAWTPADGIGPTTVYDVMTSSLTEPQEGDWDLAELRGQRTYGLLLKCLPFGRSVDAITDDSDTPPVSSGTVINAWSSTTGWTSAYGAAAPSVVSSSVETESAPYPRFNETFTFPDSVKFTVGSGTDTYVGSHAVTSGDWLSAEIRLEWPDGSQASPSAVTSIGMTLAGVTDNDVDFQLGAMDADGFVKHSWRATATGNVTELVFTWAQYRDGWGDYAPPTVRYRNLTKTAAGATGFQIVKTTDVVGSARAPVCSLHIAAPTDLDALGQVFVATMRTQDLAMGFQPDVLRWLSSGTSAADASALHGVTYTSTGAYGGAGSPVFAVPAATLLPGPYHLYALIRSAVTPITVGVEAQSMPDGVTAVGPTSTAEVTLPNTNVWRFVAVGTVTLPPVEMVNAAVAKVRLRTKGASVKWAELLLVPAAWQGRPGADVTIVDCSTGTVSASGASSHLWLEAPSAGRPYGGAFRGPTSDGLNRRAVTLSSEMKKPGQHYFSPGLMNTYALATGVAGISATPTYFPHWLGNASR